MNDALNKITVGLWWVACVCFTIDTGLFLYPSLSQTLLGGFFSLVMCAVGLVYGIRCHAQWIMNYGIVFVIAWGAYILCHAGFVEDAEHYRLMYYLVCLMLMLTFTFLLYNRLVSLRQIENGVLAMLMLQLVCLILQSMGLKESANPYYPLTGFGENPNTACILMSVCIPLLLDRLKSSRHFLFWLLLTIATVVYLITMKCRTAFVGLLVIFVVRTACSYKVRQWIKQRGKRMTCAIIATTVTLASFLAVSMYNMKKESADGRLLIWKVSTYMIADKPTGWGVGMFEKCYNLCQGQYFEKGKGTESEKKLANVVYMAYNDYLEQGGESGIIGMLLLVAFYAVIIGNAIKQRNVNALSIVCAFASMSMVSFVYSTIQAWMILIIYSASVMANMKGANWQKSRRFTYAAVVACCLLLMEYSSLAGSQMALEYRKLKSEKGKVVKTEDIKDLKAGISTSSEYYFILGNSLMDANNSREAFEAYLVALKYSSEAKLFFAIFRCYDVLGETEKGIEYIKTLSHIIPQNMLSRNILLKWYDSQGMYSEALDVANEMANTILKIDNPRSVLFQQGARNYIKTHKQYTINHKE